MTRSTLSQLITSLAVAAPLALGTGLATAQTSSTGSTGTAGAASTADSAFKRADANSDGKLSKEEAASMPTVASKFQELDTDKDGSLNLTEFMSGYKPNQ